MRSRGSTVDLDTMPQRGCPTCGITSKTAVLWPKTTPAQGPLAPAKTPLRRPEKATGRVAVKTPPWAAEHRGLAYLLTHFRFLLVSRYEKEQQKFATGTVGEEVENAQRETPGAARGTKKPKLSTGLEREL